MQKILALIVGLVIAYVASLSFVSESTSLRVLTQQEWQLLEHREKQQDTRIIADRVGELALLQTASRELDAQSPHTPLLLRQMRKAVIAYQGLGLAAVQIGVPVRVILVIQARAEERIFKAYFNPEVVKRSAAMQSSREGCLSLSNEEDHIVQRATHISIRYQAEDGQFLVEHFSGLTAAVVQQEMDHINGILLTDYVE